MGTGRFRPNAEIRVVVGFDGTGQLLSSGGERMEVFRCLDTVSGGSYKCWSLDVLENHCRGHGKRSPLEPAEHPYVHQRSLVITWPDGSEYNTAWEELYSDLNRHRP